MSVQKPFSFSSPWYQGSPTATIVSINDAKNRVQCRIDGYQDDKGNIVDEHTAWYDTLSTMHSGIAGATATHMYYPGAKVAISSCGRFVQGSITGYDSDQKKDGADSSEDQKPNTPEQVRGSKGRSEISSGEGKDVSSKGSRNPEVDKPPGEAQAEKVFDYSKQKAPFDKGEQSKFPDLKSIGIDKLTKGSDILNVIDGMDGNVSGAIQAGTKIIRNLRQGGWSGAGDAMGGSASAAGSQQVSDYFGTMSLEELVLALIRLLTAFNVIKGMTKNTSPDDLFDIPACLQDQYFDVDQSIIDGLSDAISQYRMIFGTAADPAVLIASIQGQFTTGFGVAVVNAIAYIDQVVGQAGSGAILVVGSNSVDRLLALIAAISNVGGAAGLSQDAIHNIGNGVIGQLLRQGAGAIQSIMQQANVGSGSSNAGGGGGSQIMQQVQSMMQNMNIFRGNKDAMGEIMGGGKSINESMTKIIKKYREKRSNFDTRGFTS